MNTLLYQLPIILLIIFIFLNTLSFFAFKKAYQKWMGEMTLFAVVASFISLCLLAVILLNQDKSILQSNTHTAPKVVSLGSFNPNVITGMDSDSQNTLFDDQIRLFTPINLSIDNDFQSIDNSLFNQFFEINQYGFLYAFLILLVSITSVILLNKESSLTAKQAFPLSYPSVLIITLGAFFIFFSSHIFIFYFGVELIALGMAALISSQTQYNLLATTRYWTFSIATSSFMLMGIALYYPLIKELTFSSLHDYLINQYTLNYNTLLGFSCLLIGLITKLGMVPFQGSNIGIFSRLTPTISLINIGIIQFALFCGLTRILLIAPFINHETLKFIIILLGSISILYATFAILYQKSLQSIFTYNSIIFFAYLLIPLLGSEYNVYSQEAFFILIFTYILSFVVLYSLLFIIQVQEQRKEMLIQHLKGLFWQNKFRGVMLSIGLLCLASFPITLGFISRFFLINITLSSGLWLFTASLVISTVFLLYFYLKLVIHVYIRVNINTQHDLEFKDRHWATRFKLIEIMIAFAGILLIVLGIAPQLLIDIIHLIKPIHLLQ